MSLCRWSSLDFQCDLYVYEGEEDGWSINVSNYRHSFKEPLPEEVDMNDIEAVFERTLKVMTLPYDLVPNNLPYDGESFSCDTNEEAIEVLTMLKDCGYNAPWEYLFSVLEEDNGTRKEESSQGVLEPSG